MRLNNVSKNYLHFKYHAAHRVGLAGNWARTRYLQITIAAPQHSSAFFASPLNSAVLRTISDVFRRQTSRAGRFRKGEGGARRGVIFKPLAASVCAFNPRVHPRERRHPKRSQYGGTTDSASALHNLLGSISPVRSPVERTSEFKSGTVTKFMSC